MPFQRVRPWRERPPSFDAWYGIGEGWMCTPIHPLSGGRSRPSKENQRRGTLALVPLGEDGHRSLRDAGIVQLF